ncbi:MAG: hypothetical protein JSU69_04530 [Candidatus Zixiibacteriota bacterium]|nr:MAG: hypothetical protein JSU69_04530 [candidate division Zixibacteria bacterium]
MMPVRHTLIILLILLAIFNVSSSQSLDPGDTTLTEPAADSTRAQIKNPEILYADQPLDTTVITQRPTEALFRSLFVPGWGQLGNGKYIKAGVIIALESTLIGTIVHYAKKKSAAREALERATDEFERARLFEDFDTARDQHSRFSWYLGTLIFLSMFDAYVDAHLADFPRYDKKISLDLSPERGRELMVRIAYNF